MSKETRPRFAENLGASMHMWLCENKQSAEDADLLAEEIQEHAEGAAESFQDLLKEQGLERS